VGKVGVRHADGQIPERVVNVAARDDQLRVAKQLLGDSLVERNRGHRAQPFGSATKSGMSRVVFV